MKLEDIVIRHPKSTPRIIVLGDSGVGKTTYASKFPNPVFLDVEFGTGSLDVPTIPVKSLTDFTNAIFLLKEQKHEYKTVIIDSIDWFEDILIKRICEENKAGSLADFDYGKGYALLYERWKKIIGMLEELRQKGLIVVLVSHAAPETVKHPDIAEYQRMGLSMTRTNIKEKLIAWVDIIVYIKKQGKNRTYNVESAPGFCAKCRFTNIPAERVVNPQDLLNSIGAASAAPEVKEIITAS